MTKQDIPLEIITKIEEYVSKNYSKIFKNKPIIIAEKENFYTIKPHKDAGPIILSKRILE